jgi:Phage tail assembly chaperone
MAKFKLQPEPTFRRKVVIPLPGDGKVGEIEFIFRFRSRDALADFYKQSTEKDRITTVMGLASGWDLEDEFNEANVKRLDETFVGALEKVLEAYWEEHTKAIEKN